MSKPYNSGTEKCFRMKMWADCLAMQMSILYANKLNFIMYFMELDGTMLLYIIIMIDMG